MNEWMNEWILNQGGARGPLSGFSCLMVDTMPCASSSTSIQLASFKCCFLKLPRLSGAKLKCAGWVGGFLSLPPTGGEGGGVKLSIIARQNTLLNVSSLKSSRASLLFNKVTRNDENKATKKREDEKKTPRVSSINYIVMEKWVRIMNLFNNHVIHC